MQLGLQPRWVLAFNSLAAERGCGGLAGGAGVPGPPRLGAVRRGRGSGGRRDSARARLRPEALEVCVRRRGVLKDGVAGRGAETSTKGRRRRGSAGPAGKWGCSRSWATERSHICCICCMWKTQMCLRRTARKKKKNYRLRRQLRSSLCGVSGRDIVGKGIEAEGCEGRARNAQTFVCFRRSLLIPRSPCVGKVQMVGGRPTSHLRARRRRRLDRVPRGLSPPE